MSLDPETGDHVEYKLKPGFCYRFTWVGPEVDDKANKTTSCPEWLAAHDRDSESWPCFEPLVYTQRGPNSQNEPDVDILEEKCNTEGNSNHQQCVPFCELTQNNVCITMTYYSR